MCFCVSIYKILSQCLTLIISINILIDRFTGGNVDAIPHPAVDWHDFITVIKEFTKTTPMVFDPVSNAMKPWIDVGKLNSIYKAERINAGGGSSSCILM